MILDILTFPSELLRQTSSEVTELTDEIKTLIEDMKETLYEAKGFGLAAPQVNNFIRILVYDEGAGKVERKPNVLINPVIVESSGEQFVDEGCLSVPGEYAPVQRYLNVTVRGLDEDFNPVEIKASGNLARIFQHEIDHLNGVLFLDRLPSFRRDTLKKHIKRRISSGDYVLSK
jgi:peptide deformylase